MLKKFDHLVDYTVKRAVAIIAAVALLVLASFAIVDSSAFKNAHAAQETTTDAAALNAEDGAQEDVQGDVQDGAAPETTGEDVADLSTPPKGDDQEDQAGVDLEGSLDANGAQVLPQDVPVRPLEVGSFKVLEESATVLNRKVNAVSIRFLVEFGASSWCITADNTGADCDGAFSRPISDCVSSSGSLQDVSSGVTQALTVNLVNPALNEDLNLYAFSCTDMGGYYDVAAAAHNGGFESIFPLQAHTLRYDINGDYMWNIPDSAYGNLFYLSGDNISDPHTALTIDDMGEPLIDPFKSFVDIWCTKALNPVDSNGSASRTDVLSACAAAGGNAYAASDATYEGVPSRQVTIESDTVLYATYAWKPSGHKMFALHMRNSQADVAFPMADGNPPISSYVDWSNESTGFPTFPVPSVTAGYHFAGWSTEMMLDTLDRDDTACDGGQIRSDANGLSTSLKSAWNSEYEEDAIVNLYACILANAPETPEPLQITLPSTSEDTLHIQVALVRETAPYIATDITYKVYRCDNPTDLCTLVQTVVPTSTDDTNGYVAFDLTNQSKPYTESDYTYRAVAVDPQNRESSPSAWVLATLFHGTFKYPYSNTKTYYSMYGWNSRDSSYFGQTANVPQIAALSPAIDTLPASTFANWICTEDTNFRCAERGNISDGGEVYINLNPPYARLFRAHFNRNNLHHSWFDVTPASWNGKNDGVIALNANVPAGLSFSDFEIANRGSHISCNGVPAGSYGEVVSADLINNASGQGAHYCVRLKAQSDDYKVIDASAPIDINMPAGAPLNVTVANISANGKVYDGTTAATADFAGAKVVCDGAQMDNFEDTFCTNGQDVTTITGNSHVQVSVNHDNYVATFGNPNASDTPRTVGIGGLLLAGTAANYYHLTDTPITTTATISKKPIDLYAYDVTVVENQPYTEDHLGVYSSGFVPVDAGIVQPLTGSLKLSDTAYRTAELTPGDTYPSACRVDSSAPTYQFGCIVEDADYTYDNYVVTPYDGDSQIHPGALIVTPNDELAELVQRFRRLILHLDNPDVNIIDAQNEPLAESVDFLYTFDDVMADQYNKDWLVAHDAEDNQLLEAVDRFKAEIRASNLRDFSTGASAITSADIPWNAKLVADEFGQDSPEYAALDAEIGDNHKLAQLWDIRFETLQRSAPPVNYAAAALAAHGRANVYQPGFAVTITTPTTVDSGAAHKLWHKHAGESASEHAFTRDGANLSFSTDRFSLFGVSYTSALVKLPNTGLDAVKQLALSVMVLLTFASVLHRRKSNSALV